MAALIRYVNTASTAGGDGTTNNTTGSTRAYASLNEAETGEADDLVTSGNTLTINCSGSSADTSATTFDAASWAADATNWCRIIGDFTADLYDTGAYRLEASVSYGAILSINETYISLNQVQLYNTFSSSQYQAVLEFNSTTASPVHEVDRCLIRSLAGLTTFDPSVGETMTGTGGRLSIKNTLIYDGSTGIRVSYPPTSTTVELINVTVSNMSNDGIDTDYVDRLDMYNCLVTNTTTADYDVNGTTTQNTGNNISEDATSPDSAFRNITITYTDESGDDYTYASTETDAADQGVGPGSQSLVTDTSLNANARSGATTDIGAFQIAAAAAALVLGSLALMGVGR